jgi:hypothetical protein
MGDRSLTGCRVHALTWLARLAVGGGQLQLNVVGIAELQDVDAKGLSP